MGVMYQSYSNVGPRILSTIISMPSETCNIEKSRGHLERTSCQMGGGKHGIWFCMTSNVEGCIKSMMRGRGKKCPKIVWKIL